MKMTSGMLGRMLIGAGAVLAVGTIGVYTASVETNTLQRQFVTMAMKHKA